MKFNIAFTFQIIFDIHLHSKQDKNMKKIFTLLSLLAATTLATQAQTLTTIAACRAVDATGMTSIDTGKLVNVSGVVSGPNTSTSANGLKFILSDHSKNITVFFTTNQGYSFHLGDSVVVKGKLTSYYGLAEISLSKQAGNDTIYKVGDGIVDSAKVVTAFDENSESYLVQVNAVNMDSVLGWTKKVSTKGVHYISAYIAGFTANKDNNGIYIDSAVATDIYNAPKPTGFRNIRGIGTQGIFAPKQGYQIVPRSLADFIAGPNGVESIANTLTASIFPNPSTTSLNITLPASTTDVAVRVMDITGREVYSANEASSNFTINTTDLSNGLYILSLNSAGKSMVTKFNVSK